jgi:hypothetical protein
VGCGPFRRRASRSSPAGTTRTCPSEAKARLGSGARPARRCRAARHAPGRPAGRAGVARVGQARRRRSHAWDRDSPLLLPCGKRALLGRWARPFDTVTVGPGAVAPRDPLGRSWEGVTTSLPWISPSPPCGPAFPQVACHRRPPSNVLSCAP